MDNWITVPLSDCGEWLSGGTPSKQKLEYWEGDIPWVSPKDMNTYFIWDSEDHISEDGLSNGSRLVPEDTILFVVRSMRLANEFQIAITEREVAFNQDLKAIRCYDFVDPRFLFYSLRAHSNIILGLVDEASHGTKRLKTDAIGSLEIPMPRSLDEQAAIARVVSTLDDKIELNRRENATLEAMARAIFKSWFVDFDPVHAKASGEQPSGMDAATAALFPDSFEESEWGPIPARWRVEPLSEVIEINPSRTLKKGQIAPYLGMANMPTFSARPQDWEYREFGSGMRFVNGDVLLARITPCLENGKTAYVDFLEEDQIAWGSTEYIVFRSNSDLPPEYPYFLARSEELRAFAIQNMTGTSGRQRVPASAFEHYPVVVPPEEIAFKFGDIARLFLSQIKANDDQSRTLAELRDTLLPRLISGELRVGEIDDASAF